MDIGAYVVFYDKDEPDEVGTEAEYGITVRWHGGQTFNIYNGATEVDVFTAGDEVPDSASHGVDRVEWAKDHAARWFQNQAAQYAEDYA